MREDGSLQAEDRPSVPGELVARLEVASGPAIVLDAEIFWLFDRARATTAFWRGGMGLPKPLPDDFSRLPRGLGMASLEASAPNYTASLDAALALAERTHPGADVYVGRLDGQWDADCEPVGCDRSARYVDHKGATPALALCIAILRATTPGKPSSASEGVD